MSKWKKGLAIGAGAVTLIAVGASLGGGIDATSPPAQAADRPAATSTSEAPAEQPAPQSVEEELREEQEANPEPAPPEMTAAQENAVETAAAYLDYSGFSRSGLIDQLKYEGFSKKDAEFAVDVIGVNWNQQAVRVAKGYLDYDSFSRSGLIDQLEYEGFTPEQAEYGVQKAY
jgi:Host cell surface-exposed lipoprotein